eukprot:GGOE01043583.1.p1 GENE.GGOE01043583.1~~GGOE01043583.1.p1  ORF type:complete len:202 (-),score=70.08 GGOE01043583.1:355-927(-)
MVNAARGELDFSAFPVGSAITLGTVALVRSDYRDKMKRFADQSRSLMIVSQDSKGHSLVAIDGKYDSGALQVDKDNNAVAFWMPLEQWQQLCPNATIKVGDHSFVHIDLVYRITHMATESKQLVVVVQDWHGYQLMADEGKLEKGLLMVDSDQNAVGYWMLQEEYNQLSQVQQPAPSPPLPASVDPAGGK